MACEREREQEGKFGEAHCGIVCMLMQLYLCTCAVCIRIVVYVYMGHVLCVRCAIREMAKSTKR